MGAALETLPGHHEPFTAIATCPACHHTAVHYLDTPDSREPELLDTYIIRDWAGRIDREVWHYDHPDERLWTVARGCIDCGHRWGQE